MAFYRRDKEKPLDTKTGYGQFCPLAMASEFLCKRWTLLIFRELFLGSISFNDISRGVPRMSRTLLSSRLKELEERGLIRKEKKNHQRESKYHLSESGESLRKVVFGIADWSQEWLHIEPSLENIDADHLLWSIRRGARFHPDLPNPFIVHILLSDQPADHQNGWLIFEDDEVELCIIEHDFNVDVQIEATAKSLTEVWMGWTDFSSALKNGKLILRGPSRYTKIAPMWLGHSRLAKIKKQPRKLRVF